jgi:CheY-like chemotaxis protein
VSAASVVEVGNCDADSARIRQVIESAFDARVTRALVAQDALNALEVDNVDLVLTNRVNAYDGTDCADLIGKIRSGGHADIAVMVLSNFAEAQAKAEALGAVPGFGKADLGTPLAVERLAAVLPAREEPSPVSE